MWIEYCGDLINLDRVAYITDGFVDNDARNAPEIRFYVNEKDYFAFANERPEELNRVLRNIRRTVNPKVDVALGKTQKYDLKNLEEWS